MEYLHKDRDQFAEAVDLAVFKTGLEPEVVEKDYYVTMVLKRLSEQFPFSVFKGGTSLQKCHRVISRFSEDIDIAFDRALSQGQRRKLKYGIADLVSELGMTISNMEDIRSRRDYNRYELTYDSVLDRLTDTVKPTVLLETSFLVLSFPAVILPVHSYLGDLFEEEAPELIKQYGLETFSMKVQGIDRTLADKVFAVCDYYMKGNIKRHSRHIYDIYKLLPLTAQDETFRQLVRQVRAVRAETSICPSAMPGVDVTDLLNRIIAEGVYKEDYCTLTVRLLEDKITYEEAIGALRELADSRIFDE